MIKADIKTSDEGTYYCAGCEERQRKIDDFKARVEELELIARTRFPEEGTWEGRGLFAVCVWWILTYPSDVFTGESGEGAKLVAEIRDRAKRILQIHEEAEHGED